MNVSITISTPIDSLTMHPDLTTQNLIDTIAKVLAQDPDIQDLLQDLNIEPAPSHYEIAAKTLVVTLKWLDLGQANLSGFGADSQQHFDDIYDHLSWLEQLASDLVNHEASASDPKQAEKLVTSWERNQVIARMPPWYDDPHQSILIALVTQNLVKKARKG